MNKQYKMITTHMTTEDGLDYVSFGISSATGSVSLPDLSTDEIFVGKIVDLLDYCHLPEHALKHAAIRLLDATS